MGPVGPVGPVGQVGQVKAAGRLAVAEGAEEAGREVTKLGDINTWGLDVFSAERSIRAGRVLTATAYRIFQERDLLAAFRLESHTLLTFLVTVESHYRPDTVRYHNNLHAADVTQSTHLLLARQPILTSFPWSAAQRHQLTSRTLVYMAPHWYSQPNHRS